MEDSRARKLTLATIRDMLLSAMHPANLASFKDMLNLAVRMGFVHRGLTPAEINPRLRWKMFDFLELTLITPGLGQDFCIICRNRILQGQRMGLCKCGHQYHYECVRRWLMWMNNCPDCGKQALDF